ncbi:MAG: cell envelope integrity protein CreD [Betaproteobacteria bacterium]|nr:cell envelope integrity protein CreD [Betaproteobacteria bacterium]
METYSEHMKEPPVRQTGKAFPSVAARARLFTVGKIIGVFFLTLCLMIPLGLIENQITSRSQYQEQVTAEIASTAASSQTVIGPILAIYYWTKTPEKRYRDAESGKMVTKEASTDSHVKYIPAKNLAIRGNASVERRYRGIYQARLFHLDAKADGSFEVPTDIIRIPEGSLFAGATATILFSVSDLRGLDSDPDVLVDGKLLRFRPPTDKRFDGAMGGNRLEIDLGAWASSGTRIIPFSFPLKLTGTEALSISPTAENNIVELASDWKHPSFKGRFLPRERTVNETGFTAKWEISQLARNWEKALNGASERQKYYEGERGIETEEVLKVTFIDPVNIYLQAERAVKYGILFIVLTFAAFFFIGEALRRRPMHLMQYALVGLSLAIFFLLLIALSEHLPFALAYLTGAAACIGLITIYLAGAFGSWRMASGFGGGLAILYGMLFYILQLEDMGLLMGSLLLFAALAAIMMSTRRFNWYQLKKQGEITVEASGE